MSIPSLRLICNQAVNLPLFFKRRVEKKKFADVSAFPEEKEEERQMVGTAGRRLLSVLCFYFSLDVISFYSIFYIICFLKTGGGLSSRREEDKRRFCSQGLNRPFAPMKSFYYNHQNPSGFCFLVQIRAFVI